MRRTTTHARGSHVRAAFLNAIQDEQVGFVPGSENPAGATAITGFDGRYVCTPDAGVANNTLAVLDDSVDWRSRLLRGAFVRLETAAQRLHGADSWQANDPTRPVAVRLFEGRTGTGGLGAAAAAVANGTPPVIASGAFAVVVDEAGSGAARVYLYAAADGSLCLYNASGSTLHGELQVWGAAVAPNPSAPPPDVLPTLTEVQWLTPGLAAARPADPGGPSIFRATDTGALSLWDGGAWRAVGGGGSPLTTDGDIFTRAGGADARLPVGSSGQVLRVSGGAPVWGSLPWLTDTSTGVSTADATQATCGSYTVPNNAGVSLELTVHAERADLTAGAMWKVRAHARNNAGAVSISGSVVDVDGPTGDAVSWSVTLDVSGTSVRLRVTGQAATDVSWTARWIVG